MKTWHWVVIGIVGLFIVGAIAGGGQESGESGDEAADTSEPAAEQAEAAPKCRKAPRVLVRALAGSLSVQVGGGIDNAQVVKVPDPPPPPLRGLNAGVYIAAGELIGPGMDGTVGAWAVSKPMLSTGGGLAFGLDTVTREFSDLGVAASDDSPARDYTDELEATDAYEQAVSCAEG